MSLHRVPRLVITALVLLGLAVPASAQRNAKVPDPDPELERQALQPAEGFEVNLFAADPLLAKPIQMNFDARGRLWVACSEVYPQIQPGQTANDKVIILEDTKGTGRADKVTVFADGLLIPTGVEPGDGGAYVANSTDLLHFKAGPDGRGGPPRIVLSGFGTEDTHHILHTLRWGPDGLLNFNQSVYIHSHIETPYGVRRLNAGGVWQYRPGTGRLEVFVRGMWNSWGHHFDRWGQSFLTDGAGSQGVMYGPPGTVFEPSPGAVRFFPGLNPGSPKYCGGEVVSGRHLPPGWDGNFVTNDFRGHRVCRFEPVDDGAGFAAKQLPDLIRSDHPAFRPIDVKMGPDGAIYVADWYNPIIQHGEVDFRDPRRDQTHGRIWRVTAKGRPLVPRPKLADAPTDDLLAALKAPEEWTRRQAKRVLKERGQGVVPELAAWMKALDPADADYEHEALEALWTYQSLDVVEPALLTRLLTAHEPRARAAAVRVLAHWRDRLPNALDLLAARVDDDLPRVRMEAVRALGSSPDARAATAALRALDKPVDRFLDYALWLTARESAPRWLPAHVQGQFDFDGNVRHLVYALQAVGSREAVQALAQLVRAGRVPAGQEDGVLATVAAQGGADELGLVFDRVLGFAPAEAGRQVNVLGAMEQAARQRGVRPSGDLDRIGRLFDAPSDGVRTAATRLAGLWQREALRPKLLALAHADDTPAPLRKAAIDSIAAIGGPAGHAALSELAAPDRPRAVRRQAVGALAALDVNAAVAPAVELLASGTSGEEITDLVGTFTRQRGGPAALTTALSSRTLPADVAKLAVRAVKTGGREQPALVEALNKAGHLEAVLRTLSPADLERMVADVAKLGDPARGEAVYRRKEQVCQKCHAIGGAGGLVGPDLASIGASAPVDYLIDSILLPNKVVKENYHTLAIATTAGKIITGIKVRETATELVLRDAEDREVSIPIKDVDERNEAGSLMPEGLADDLTRGELLDLVRFLSELGKVGKYSVGTGRVVRRWQVLQRSPAEQTMLQHLGPGRIGEGEGIVWTPAYSRVAGDLPAEDVPPTGVVRCHLEATTGGPVRLRLSGTAGLKLWLDGVEVPVQEMVPLKLTAGHHALTFQLDRAARYSGLRCAVEDVPSSPARVTVVGGK